MDVKNMRWLTTLKVTFAVTAVALLMVACTSSEQAEVPAEEEVMEGGEVVATAVATAKTTPILPTATAPETIAPTATTAPTSTAPAVQLPDLGPAPEIHNEIWLNTDAPVTLASVQGEKAVLLEFWTFG